MHTSWSADLPVCLGEGIHNCMESKRTEDGVTNMFSPTPL